MTEKNHRNVKINSSLKPSLTGNALTVLEKRYLARDEKGDIIETPEGLFSRVAAFVASADFIYGAGIEQVNMRATRFYEMMASMSFMPNSPTLMNAARPLGQLSACFVLPVEDSMEGIFDSLKNMALIHKSGGGTGFSFSRLRPKNDIVSSTAGVSSGPVSFMNIFNSATETVKQGGTRRGANMAILSIDHPDIMEFIQAKSDHLSLTNFNISVAVTDRFMDAVKMNGEYDLVNPRSGEPVGRLNARRVYDLIVEMAWRNGEPGIVFIDRINEFNPLKKVGAIESTNPCGEQPLLPYESCNLGSINLTKIIEKNTINWEKLKEIVQLSVRFLDDVIEVNKYPFEQIRNITLGNRKIGLGVMGWADMLAELEIEYGSKESIKLAGEIMGFINKTAFEYSVKLGRERGSFPNFSKSIYTNKIDCLRNCTRTTIAPTGTISIIANCSSGIEPFFAIAYIRRISGGSMFEVNPIWEKKADSLNLLKPEIMAEIIKKGSVNNVKGIPEKMKKIFRTALEIKPELHLLMQATFQKYTDNAVSKTINLAEDASIKQVKNIFTSAYKLRCKGTTVFRYGSKPSQVLYLGEDFAEDIDYLSLGEEFAGCSRTTCNF